MPPSTRHAHVLFVSMIALSMIGCGPAPYMETAEEGTSTGSESAQPSGPPPSFLPAGQHVFARVDVARIRRSPIGPDVSSAIRASETWQMYAGSSGLDPVESFDALVVAADAVYADRRTLLVRHTGTDADVRDAVLRMSVARDAAPVWSELDGFPVVVPPSSLTVEHSLVLTAPHEIVFGPTDDLSRVVTVARDQRARRQADEAIDPALAFGPNEIATFRVDEPPARREGWPEPPLRYSAQITEDDAHTATVQLHGEYASPELAHAAREYFAQLAAYYAGQMLVRAAGLSRPLESAVFTESGSNLDMTTTFTTEEVRRGLGAMALMQLQSAR